MKKFQVALLIFFIATKAQALTHEGLPDKSTPAMWIDEKNLLLISDHEISQYNLEQKSVVKVLYRADKNLLSLNSSSFCFTPNRWMIRADKLDGTISTLEIDPKNLTAKLENGFDNFNTFDCKASPTLASPPPTISHNNKTYSFFRFAPRAQLVKETDGETFLYGGSDGFVVSAKNSKGVDKKIFLGGANGQNIESFDFINSAFDKARDFYLWYPHTSHFEKEQGAWPLRAWWVARDLTIASDLIIPAGPWVIEKYDCTKCPECGCECGSQMRLYVNDGRIFIKIWGESVDKENRGFYELIHATDLEKSFWKKLILEDVKSEILFSPDNCRIAYVSEKNEAKISNLCN